MENKNTKPLVFMITGVARAGKDTFAACMMEKFNGNGNRCEVFKFADVLKERANDVLRAMGVFRQGVVDFHAEDFKVKHRGLLVELGRTLRGVDKDIFARHLNAQVALFMDYAPLGVRPVALVSDWRYLNEHVFLSKHLDVQIVTVEIQRPGFGPANDEEAGSLADMMSSMQILHTRLAVDPAGVRAVASEIYHIYR
ncbi:hypothetical protein UFOVP583_27 [uncultured Caudovirales phage]|uniref:Deoxynucleoside monophosphate kinase n=1 Tax=uncultured Caudovirales phage TaxID=2100421 RepID=A0A6J5N016_9CAUD|nr:hypothetical protein UFOVP583_27 [uncultured Caudovirales phage]